MVIWCIVLVKYESTVASVKCNTLREVKLKVEAEFEHLIGSERLLTLQLENQRVTRLHIHK